MRQDRQFLTVPSLIWALKATRLPGAMVIPSLPLTLYMRDRLFRVWASKEKNGWTFSNVRV